MSNYYTRILKIGKIGKNNNHDRSSLDTDYDELILGVYSRIDVEHQFVSNHNAQTALCNHSAQTVVVYSSGGAGGPGRSLSVKRRVDEIASGPVVANVKSVVRIRRSKCLSIIKTKC